jgi:hypothetical protein
MSAFCGHDPVYCRWVQAVATQVWCVRVTSCLFFVLILMKGVCTHFKLTGLPVQYSRVPIKASKGLLILLTLCHILHIGSHWLVLDHLIKGLQGPSNLSIHSYTCSLARSELSWWVLTSFLHLYVAHMHYCSQYSVRSPHQSIVRECNCSGRPNHPCC